MENFKEEIASLLLMVHDHYLRHLVGSDITLALSKFVSGMNLQDDVSVLDIERMRFQVMGQSSHPMEFDAFFAWLRTLAMFLYKRRDINGRMAFHVFLVEHLVPSVSEAGYGEAKPGTINSEDAPLKLLTTDAWLLYTPLDEFFHLHFLSLANEVSAPLCDCSNLSFSLTPSCADVPVVEGGIQPLRVHQSVEMHRANRARSKR